MTSRLRLPTHLSYSRPRRCPETISQGYPQTVGFSSEISSWCEAVSARATDSAGRRRCLTRRREKLVEHDIDNHARHRNVHPDRPCPSGQTGMSDEVRLPGTKESHDNEWHDSSR